MIVNQVANDRTEVRLGESNPPSRLSVGGVPNTKGITLEVVR